MKSNQRRVIICDYCHEEKHLKWPHEVKRRRYCSKGCSAKHKAQRMKGTAPARAIEARKTQADLKALLQARDQFGPLTQRELAIWRDGEARGYQCGYNIGYRSLVVSPRKVA